MDRNATVLVDSYLLAHALARFELLHQGYPVVSDPADLAPALVPAFLSQVPATDPWDRSYRYAPHDVLVREDPKLKIELTDSYELTVRLLERSTGEFHAVRIFNGTFIEAPPKLLGTQLSLRSYPRHPGPVSDVRQALTMFGLARPLELVKFVALRALEDVASADVIPELQEFLKFNEPARLKQVARDALERAQSAQPLQFAEEAPS